MPPVAGLVCAAASRRVRSPVADPAARPRFPIAPPSPASAPAATRGAASCHRRGSVRTPEDSKSAAVPQGRPGTARRFESGPRDPDPVAATDRASRARRLTTAPPLPKITIGAAAGSRRLPPRRSALAVEDAAPRDARSQTGTAASCVGHATSQPRAGRTEPARRRLASPRASRALERDGEARRPPSLPIAPPYGDRSALRVASTNVAAGHSVAGAGPPTLPGTKPGAPPRQADRPAPDIDDAKDGPR